MGNVVVREMKVVWLGLRGFPGVMGGVEAHAEKICPRLVQLGCDTEVIARSPYVPAGTTEFRGVRVRRLWAPRSKYLESFIHSFLGVLYCAVKRPDIVHIQAIGPAIMTPLARLLGLRVIVTHHGPDYDRQKWGGLAKLVLRRGEAWGMRFANARISISETIEAAMGAHYGVECVRIPNGVDLPALPGSAERLEQFGLVARHFVLLVSRLVPEKRHEDLIRAFSIAQIPGWKLALVGSSDHPDRYTARINELAQTTPNVVTTGFQSGETLKQLFAHAGLFVLPSSHEGLPIALLEALSYGLPVLASDIPANREVGLAEEQYFALGDVEQLAERFRVFARSPNGSVDRDQVRRWVAERYSWDAASRTTLQVYHGVLGHTGQPAL